MDLNTIRRKEIQLLYTTGTSSPYEGDHSPAEIKVRQPKNSSSRWCTQKNDQRQFLEIILLVPSLVLSVSFGKYHKIHSCNIKELWIYGKTPDVKENIFSESTWILLSKAILENNTEDDTILLPTSLSNGKVPVLEKLVIVPRSTWTPNYNYSIWYLQLNGYPVTEEIQRYNSKIEYDHHVLSLFKHSLKHSSQENTSEEYSLDSMSSLAPNLTKWNKFFRSLKELEQQSMFKQIELFLIESSLHPAYREMFIKRKRVIESRTIKYESNIYPTTVMFDYTHYKLYSYGESRSSKGMFYAVPEECTWKSFSSSIQPNGRICSIFYDRYLLFPYESSCPSGDIKRTDLITNESVVIKDSLTLSIKRIRVIPSPVSTKVFVYTERIPSFSTGSKPGKILCLEEIDVIECTRKILRGETKQYSGPSLPYLFESATVLSGWQDRIELTQRKENGTPKEVICFLSLISRSLILYSIETNRVFKTIPLPPQEESFLDKVSIHTVDKNTPYSEILFRAGRSLYIYSEKQLHWEKLHSSIPSSYTFLGHMNTFYLVDMDTLKVMSAILSYKEEDSLFVNAIRIVRIGIFRNLLSHSLTDALAYLQTEIHDVLEEDHPEDTLLNLSTELVHGCPSQSYILKELADLLLK
ncbi:muskelin [Nematocida sp. AWRm80]|nr:muskelin [Nematocida sp. AWRm80]